MTDIKIRVEKLLEDVGKEVEKSNEIARLKGENFNIFKILGVERKENNTHSNFLSELLNPNGVHGLGDIFLNLFFENLRTKLPDSSNSKIIIEQLQQQLQNEPITIKKEDTKDVESGRVDISIRGNKKIVFIENKIDAPDGENQIANYSTDSEKQNKVVFYLTLDGREPDNKSIKIKNNSESVEVNKDFFLLSYHTDIKDWLEKCQKEASDYPIVRETIKQYSILIKKLTGQLTDQKMENEIINLILKNKESFETAKTINNLYDIAFEDYINSVIEEIKKHLVIEGIKLETYTHTQKKDIPKQSFFVKVIPCVRPKTDMVYDIGINVELNNTAYPKPIFYFCVSDKEKGRKDEYNKYFTDVFKYTRENLSEKGIKTEKDTSSNPKRNRFDEITFDLIKSDYFDILTSSSKKDNEESSFKIIAKEIIKYIKASKLKEYSPSHS